MKKQYIAILLFYWVFHFLVPWIDFVFFEYVNLYSEVQGYEGMVLNTIAIWGAVLIIWFIPMNDQPILPSVNHAVSFFIIAIIISVYKFISGGGYIGSLEGATHGTFISFLSLFFNVNTAFLLMFCLQRNIRNIYLLLFGFLLFMTATGSRSGIIMVIIVFIILPLFSNFQVVKSKFYKFILVLGVFSPILFFYATMARGDIDQSVLGKLIIGRISMIEISMIPLEGKESNSMDKAVFYEKFSLSNQFKQSINAITPIDFFPYDVAPNQYYRVAFLGRDEINVLDSYWSMNLTLPVYFAMMTNLVVGVFLSILFLVALFLFWVRFKANIYIFILVITALYDVLYYFDWVMVVQVMFSTFLTLFALKNYDQILETFIFLTKRIFNRL